MPAGNPLGYLTGGGTDASGIGVPEKAMPGSAGDLDSILLQLQSGQLSAEALLPLLMMLAGGGMGAPPVQGGPPAPQRPMPPEGPAQPGPGGGPIDDAFGAGGEIPPELLGAL